MLGPWYVGDVPVASLVITVTREGAAVDTSAFDAVDATLTSPSGTTAAWLGTTAISATGTVTLGFPVTSVFTEAGMYSLGLTLIATGVGTERFDPIGIKILPVAAPEHWCTAAEAYDITGREVTRADLTKAHYDIEIVSGRLFQRLADGVLCDDDRDWLKRAVSHQAVFVNERPEKDIAVEGVEAAGDAVVIGSMARRALNNVSWIGARSVRIARDETLGLSVFNTTDGDIEGAPWRNL